MMEAEEMEDSVGVEVPPPTPKHALKGKDPTKQELADTTPRGQSPHPGSVGPQPLRVLSYHPVIVFSPHSL